MGVVGRGRGGIWSVCVWGSCSYLNRASPAPSSHCGLCTLILCAGTRKPLIHRWVEATANLKRIASRLASKWKQPYSKTCGYIHIYKT